MQPLGAGPVGPVQTRPVWRASPAPIALGKDGEGGVLQLEASAAQITLHWGCSEKNSRHVHRVRTVYSSRCFPEGSQRRSGHCFLATHISFL